MSAAAVDVIMVAYPIFSPHNPHPRSRKVAPLAPRSRGSLSFGLTEIDDSSPNLHNKRSKVSTIFIVIAFLAAYISVYYCERASKIKIEIQRSVMQILNPF